MVSQDLDSSFPQGPWISDSEALEDLQKYARNLDFGGGGWAVRFQASVEGTKRRIGCCQAHSERRRGGSALKERHGSCCRWGITLERGEDALWRIFSALN